jgi:hypothetical protein
MKLINIIIGLLTITILISNASALGIGNAEFFDVEQGTNKTIMIPFYTADKDIENDYQVIIIEEEGKFKDWITVEPWNFTFEPGKEKKIAITLSVPEDADLGTYSGDFKIAGSRIVGSSSNKNIAYTVATKSILHFNVVKQGARVDLTITSVNSPEWIKSNDIGKIVAVVENAGNIPTYVEAELYVYNKSGTLAPGDPIKSTKEKVNVNEFKIFNLYWEPAEAGTYKGKIKFKYEGGEVSSDVFTIIVDEAAPNSDGADKTFLKVDNFLVSVLIILICTTGYTYLSKKEKKSKEPDNQV